MLTLSSVHSTYFNVYRVLFNLLSNVWAILYEFLPTLTLKDTKHNSSVLKIAKSKAITFYASVNGYNTVMTQL